MRALLATLVLAAALGAAGTAAAGASEGISATPVGRLPFPERGYVLDLPQSAIVSHDQVTVKENGLAVGDFDFTPLSASGLRYGAILAIDASDSMKGKPEAAALAAARTFVAQRGPSESVGIVTFNGSVSTLQRPTQDVGKLTRSLAGQPTLAYGTRIFDAIETSLNLLKADKLTTGSIILLSDGADVGSRSNLEGIVAAAQRQHVRVFTVGLRSGAFDGATLHSIADRTGGTFASASSKQLSSIYGALGSRLASEYLLQYRSAAAPRLPVDVAISIDGVGSTHESYTAPTPSGLPPYHRSLATRLLLNPVSAVLVALIVAAFALLVVRGILESSRSRVIERVLAFSGELQPETRRREREPRRRARAGIDQSQPPFSGFVARLRERLDIGRIDMTPGSVIGLTVLATVLAVFVLSLISGVVAIFGLGVPFIAKVMIDRKVRQIRAAFADQLPPNLQVLAGALRAGHSFTGAFVSCVDNAEEPSKGELGRAITDEQLGMPMDDAIRKVAVRMASRDLEQVALLAELQRTTGGNAAEMLDIVVATIRERADLRRLVQTLTAQGRLARWILSALPVVTGLAFWAINPQIYEPMLRTTGGQVAFVCAGILVALGSVVIQRIVEIEV